MDDLKKQMRDIMGEWNGDEPGDQEVRYGYAHDVLTHIEEIERLLQSLYEI